MPAIETLNGKVALITGAGSGIGAEAARLLSDHNAKVVIADRDPTSARPVAAETGGHAIAMDVTSEADWTRTIAETAATLGGLDMLVNCAGIELVRSLSRLALADPSATLMVRDGSPRSRRSRPNISDRVRS